MSGFDSSWLALREPVDTRSRDRDLLSAFAEAISRSHSSLIVDIGCGTGSTLRALGPHLPPDISWRLFDHDQRLLDEADRLNGGKGNVTFLRGDLTDLATLPLHDADAVTASALFDLCSADFIGSFAEYMAATDTVVYAALNYDGRISWSTPHPLDKSVLTDFNTHQRRDKGLGPALGSDAALTLAEALSSQGYVVTTGESPWIMTAADNALQAAFLNGLLQPVREIGQISENDLHAWHAFRLDALRTDSRCTVGHCDVLAIPQDRRAA